MPALVRKDPLWKSATCLVLLLALTGCQNPRSVTGRRVIGTLWENGHVVYVLAASEEDRAATRQTAKEAEEAAREVTFEPVKR